MYINKTILSAIVTLCVSILTAAGVAYSDVQTLKVEVKNYRDNQQEIKDDLRVIKEDIKKLLSRGG